MFHLRWFACVFQIHLTSIVQIHLDSMTFIRESKKYHRIDKNPMAAAYVVFSSSIVPALPNFAFRVTISLNTLLAASTKGAAKLGIDAQMGPISFSSKNLILVAFNDASWCSNFSAAFWAAFSSLICNGRWCAKLQNNSKTKFKPHPLIMIFYQPGCTPRLPNPYVLSIVLHWWCICPAFKYSK